MFLKIFAAPPAPGRHAAPPIEAGIATLCTRISQVHEVFDPNMVKVVLDAQGYALYFSRAPVPYHRDEFSKHGEQLPQLPAGTNYFRHLGLYAYRAADLFVLSAKAETQPIVLLEAMASRTPWLATDTGCVSELPGGVVVRSEDELVEKMRELASSPADGAGPTQQLLQLGSE